jgi:hypothetical protein
VRRSDESVRVDRSLVWEATRRCDDLPLAHKSGRRETPTREEDEVDDGGYLGVGGDERSPTTQGDASLRGRGTHVIWVLGGKMQWFLYCKVQPSIYKPFRLERHAVVTPVLSPHRGLGSGDPP